MADLNALIAQGAQFRQPTDPFAQYGQLQKLESARQENALNLMKMDEYKRGVQEQNALRSSIASDFDINNPAHVNAVLRASPTAGASFLEKFSQGAKERELAAKAKNEALKFNLDNSRSLLVGVNDQPSYDSWRTYSIKTMPELAQILPAQFSPETKSALLTTADDMSKKLTAAPSYQSVAAGSTLTKDGAPIYTAPAAPEKPAAPTNLAKLQTEFAALPPGDPRRADYLAAIRKETQFAPQPVTNVNVKSELAESVKRAEYNATEFNNISTTAKLAAKTLPTLETQERILDSGFKTGFGTETQKAAASVLAVLGVPEAEKYAAKAETFNAAANNAVLQKQLEQKGTQSQSDAERMQRTTAQLGNTPQGNKFIISVAKAQAKRDMQQRDFYSNWWKNNKTYEGAEDAWYAGEGGASLFERPELKAYAAKPSSAEPAVVPNRPSGPAVSPKVEALLKKYPASTR